MRNVDPVRTDGGQDNRTTGQPDGQIHRPTTNEHRDRGATGVAPGTGSLASGASASAARRRAAAVPDALTVLPDWGRIGRGTLAPIWQHGGQTERDGAAAPVLFMLQDVGHVLVIIIIIIIIVFYVLTGLCE